MSRGSLGVDPDLFDYVAAHSMPPDPVLADLVTETEALGGVSSMQVDPVQAGLLTLLARATGARRAVEVGTFTGASALAVARGMGREGRVLCCDVSEEWTAVARRAWERAGVADRIELRLGPALDTLRGLPVEPTYDLAFVDADKGGYVGYLEELVPRLRPGGLLLADNVLWSGRVADDADREADTEAIRTFNDRVAADDRLDAVVLPVFDGLTVAVRR